jgi:beta-glucosidase
VGAVRFGVARPLGDGDIEEAAARAAEADVALVFVGRTGEWDCEGNDLPGLRLPGRQDELVARVAAANPRTVVVLQTGGPVLMPWLDDVAAVLEAWYPGQEAGNAIADVLFGEVEPGGRLPQTFPKRLEDNSAITGDALTYPGKDGHVAYREGVFVGYRHFDRAGRGTLFPFGFGLSYTRFGWGPVTLSAATLQPGGSVTATVAATNSGERAGSDVVQVYVRPLGRGAERPVKELRGFAKLALGPGESGEATVTLTARDLAFFDAGAGAWLAPAGRYEVVAASDAESVRSAAELRLESDWVEPVRRE